MNKLWVSFDHEGVKAVKPDTGTLEDFGFIRQQVAQGRKTRLDESGNIPLLNWAVTKIITKEVAMPEKSKTGDGIIGETQTTVNPKILNFMGTGANPENTLAGAEPFLKPITWEGPLPKTRRHRRPNGTAPGIEITIFKIATIPIYIPKRPADMEKVIIQINYQGRHWEIDWNEGDDAYDALEAYFNKQGKE